MPPTLYEIATQSEGVVVRNIFQNMQEASKKNDSQQMARASGPLLFVPRLHNAFPVARAYCPPDLVLGSDYVAARTFFFTLEQLMEQVEQTSIHLFPDSVHQRMMEALREQGGNIFAEAEKPYFDKAGSSDPIRQIELRGDFMLYLVAMNWELPIAVLEAKEAGNILDKENMVGMIHQIHPTKVIPALERNLGALSPSREEHYEAAKLAYISTFIP